VVPRQRNIWSQAGKDPSIRKDSKSMMSSEALGGRLEIGFLVIAITL
jgi:hypothetical protein